MSIHPRWTQKIFSGKKTVEVRRRPPDAAGMPVLIYATAPESRIVGRAQIAGVKHGTPEDLWDQLGARSALTETEFLAYLAGASTPGVLELAEISAVPPRLLPFPAPQSWMWLDGANPDHTSLVEATRAVGRNRPLRLQPSI